MFIFIYFRQLFFFFFFNDTATTEIYTLSLHDALPILPWEQMGFARYDAHTNEMELVADTAAGGRTSFRFDANAGLTGEAVRLRRPVVAHALRPDQVVVPGGERPGAEVLVPLYHAGQLVGLWSVRH